METFVPLICDQKRFTGPENVCKLKSPPAAALRDPRCVPRPAALGLQLRWRPRRPAAPAASQRGGARHGAASGGDFRGPAAACTACTACAACAACTARTRRLPVGMGREAAAPCCHLLGALTRTRTQPSLHAPAPLPSPAAGGTDGLLRVSQRGFAFGIGSAGAGIDRSVANGSSSVGARCRVVTGKPRWQ